MSGRRGGWRNPAGVAAFAIVASLAMRLPTLALLPPWGDEVITIHSIALPPGELLVERLRQMHSPVYFWLLQLLGLDGGSLFLLRLPSALADSLGAGLTALVAWRLGGWRAGIALGLLYAAMPVLLEEAQDARPYAGFFGCLGLLLWSATRLVDRPRLAAAAFGHVGARRAARRLRWTWVACAGAATGLVALLPLGLFALAAVDLAVLWKSPRLRRPWLVQRAITLLLLAPLLYGFAVHVGRFAGDYWYVGGWNALLRTLAISAGAGVEFDPDRCLGPAGNLVLRGLFLVLVLLGLLWARRRPSRAIVLGLAVGAPLLLVAASQHTPLYAVRYFALATPALTLLAALGLAGLVQHLRLPGLALAAATVALLVLQSLDAMHQLGKPRIDLAVARLSAAGIERLVVHAENRYQPTAILYHLPQGQRLSPWAAYLAVRDGRLLWIFDYAYRPIDPTWQALARQGAFAVCRPRIGALAVLAVARDPALLAASCPGDPA